jgi:hypothetical protein
MKKLMCFLAFVLIFSSGLYAQKNVTINIVDNINPSGTKYFVYHKMLGGTYASTDRKDCGLNKLCTYTIAAPVALGTHIFAATAYAADGATIIESPFSNDFTWHNAPVAPTITGTVASITRSEATLMAQSSLPSRTTLRYTEQYPPRKGYTRTVSTSYVTDHSVRLTGLRRDMLYGYVWTATNSEGQVATFAGNFRTAR